VVAVVERGTGQGAVSGKDGCGQEKEEQQCGERGELGGSGWGLRRGCNHDEHSFLLPHFAVALCLIVSSAESISLEAGLRRSLLRCEPRWGARWQWARPEDGRRK